MIIASASVSLFKGSYCYYDPSDPLLDGSKYVVEISGNINKPGKYHALIGEDLINVVKRARPKRYSDLQVIEGKVEKDTSIWVARLDNIYVTVDLNGAYRPIKMSCGSRVNDLKKKLHNYKIEKKLLNSRRLLKHREIIKFYNKHLKFIYNLVNTLTLFKEWPMLLII